MFRISRRIELIEKSLQSLLERNLFDFLGIRFVATEYSTGKSHRGRIDTLGLDENNCPVIIEYKRTMNENSLNQVLYYLDWLLDHKAEFQLRVSELFGGEIVFDRMVGSEAAMHRGKLYEIRRICCAMTWTSK